MLMLECIKCIQRNKLKYSILPHTLKKYVKNILQIIHLSNTEQFIEYCSNGYINEAKWIYFKGVNIHLFNDKALKLSCTHVYLYIAQWIYSIYSYPLYNYIDRANDIIYIYSDESLIRKALYNIQNIDILTNTFYLSCINGHLHIANWLYSLGCQITDNLFILTCACGQLNIAKWLYKYSNIDVNSYNNSSFEYSCINGHDDVAEWLLTKGTFNTCKNTSLYNQICKKGYIKVSRLFT